MVNEQVKTDFERARQKAFLHDLLAVFHRRPNDLIPYHEVKNRVNPERESYRGMQTVPTHQIIGSMDRFRDFDREFLPRHNYIAGRWQNIDRAYYEDVRLPPVQLYKVGEVYFVKDGNHRVSVARERGVEYIDAEVIEGHVRVPIYASMTASELLLQVEYAEFLRLTDLDRLCPDHDLRPTALGRYDEMWYHILVQQETMADHLGRAVTVPEAVRSWYDDIYLPIVRVARERGVTRRFSDRSETDIYLWVMAHRHELEEREGQEIAPEVSAQHYADEVEREATPSARLKRVRDRMKRRLGPRRPPPIQGP